MNPELNREYPDPGEARLIEEMFWQRVQQVFVGDEALQPGRHYPEALMPK